MKNYYSNRLKSSEYKISSVSLFICQQLVKKYHYTGGGSNTAVYRHGIFEKDSFWDQECLGIAWWIPPTKSAAQATYPENWRGVLSLSRLVVLPDVPQNGASFLLGRSMRLIDRKTWPCLVTYADSYRQHKGTIYKATNWEDLGETEPQPIYQLNGRIISRKAGPRTRTHQEMINIGCEFLGRFPKRKFRHVKQG